MTRMGRTAGVLFGGVALTAAFLVQGPAQAAPRQPERPQSPATASVTTAAQKISWRRCPDDRTVQCGTLTVPIDWSNPKRGSVKLAVARAKATDPKKRIGVLLVNPGGPGGSGVEFALDRAGLSKQVRQRYDIVGFDPRGTGGSRAVKCGKVGKAPRAYPRNQAEFDKLKKYQAALYKACRAKTGALYDFLGAGSVARDMDAIRAALGAKKVSFYGVSYGTWLGQRYAELFPTRLRGLALDSAMDHTVNTAARFSVDEARGLEAAYGQFARWCRTSKHCALRGKDAVKVLDGLMARADKGTLHEIGDPKERLEATDLAQMVRVSSYDPISWAQLGEELRELSRQKVRQIKTGTAEAVAVDGRFAGILCADWSFPIRDHKALAAVRAETRRAAPHVRLNPLGWEAITACLGRPAAKDPQRPYRVRNAPPSLVVNAVADPVTVYPWAVSTTLRIPRTSLLTYRGSGHGAYMLSPCSRKTVDAYLLSGKTPRLGATCPAVAPDFTEARGSSRGPAKPRRF